MPGLVASVETHHAWLEDRSKTRADASDRNALKHVCLRGVRKLRSDGNGVATMCTRDVNDPARTVTTCAVVGVCIVGKNHCTRTDQTRVQVIAVVPFGTTFFLLEY